MSYTNITSYLRENEFVNHPMGNYACYGLNNFGCESTILCNNKLMKFYAFEIGSSNAIYIDINGTEHIIYPYDDTLNITRMISKNDLKTYPL
jgi:hypothetical protein